MTGIIKCTDRRRHPAPICRNPFNIHATSGLLLLLVAAVVFLPARSLRAQEWTGSVSSSWSNPANWDGGVPGANGTADIATLVTQVTYDYTGEPVLLGILELDAGAVFSMSGNSLSAGHEFLGINSNATIDQSGGTNDVAYLIVDGIGGLTSWYNLSGTGIVNVNGTFSPNEVVGGSGFGIFEQIGGSNTIGYGGELNIGQNNGSQGTYSLGAGVLSTPSIYVGGSGLGAGGTGILSVSGGTVTAGSIVVYSGGSMTESAGSITANSLTLDGPFTYQGGGLSVTTTTLNSGGTIGGSGFTIASGQTLTQTGGRVSVNSLGVSGVYNYQSGTIGSQSITVNSGGTLNAGYAAGLAIDSGAVLNISGGAVANSGSEEIGLSGAGTVNLTSGSNTVGGGALILGAYTSGSTGTYNLGGTGSLSVDGDELVGNNGTGIVNQTGGTNTLNSGAELDVGSNSATNGTYTLSGGTLSAPIIYLGGSSYGSGGAGTLAISGSGTLSAGGITVYSGGSVTESGGSITANALTLDGPFTYQGGSFNVTTTTINSGGTLGGSGGFTIAAGQTVTEGSGGTVSVPNLAVSGTYNYQAGTLSSQSITVNAGGTLNASFVLQMDGGQSLSIAGGAVINSGAEYIGYSAVGTVSQTSGSNTLNSGAALDVGYSNGSNGTYTLSGGTLSDNGGEIVGFGGTGTFNQSGGSNTVVSSSLFVGGSVNSNGTYNLSGTGSLSVSGNEYVGSNGIGTVNQTGGTNTIGNGGDLDLGTANTGSGTYALSGGTVTAPLVFIGGYSAAAAGAGNFTVSGGTLLAGPITIYSSGEMTQSGGTIDAGSLSIGGPFNYQGGTFDVTTTTLKTSGSLAGPSFTLGAGLTLNQTGGITYVDNLNLSGSYNYSGGNVTVVNAMALNPGGSFNAAGLGLTISNGQPPAFTGGGTLSVASLGFDGGGLTVNSLTVSAGATVQATQGGAISVSQTSTSSISGKVFLDGGASLTAVNNYLFVDNGGLLSVANATVSADPGILNYSGGEIRLSNANSASIITPSMFNQGLLDGSGWIYGPVSNSAGTIDVDSGQSITITGAGNLNENSGVISLTGGTIHYTQDLTNETGGQISGWGTFRFDGGLTNQQPSYVTLGGGSAATYVYGSITNNNILTFASFTGSNDVFATVNNGLADMYVTGNGTSYFFGPVNNNSGGYVIVGAGSTAYFLNKFTGTAPFNNGGSITFDGVSTSGPISGNGGVTIGSGSSLQIVANSGVSVQSALTIETGSKLDMTNNDLVVHNASSTAAAAELTQITSQIKNGFNGGSWTGLGGITSSTAAASSNTALGVELNSNGNGGTLVSDFDGQPVTNTDVLVKYTYFGDANLDGVVNGSDYTLIDNAFNFNSANPTTPLTGWRNGDFNYDGVINGDDYILIDNAFNTQGPAITAVTAGGADGGTPAEMIATDTDQIAAASSAAVPEPGTLGVLAMGVVGLLIPRRRNRRAGKALVSHYVAKCRIDSRRIAAPHAAPLPLATSNQ